MDDNEIKSGAAYRNILILESRDWWTSTRADYDPARDLILTYDLGLRREIERLGGQVRYVDHLCSQSEMQENNLRIYRFFRDWHRDGAGGDLFRYRDVDFGFSFRLDFWNDYTFYIRTLLCLENLRTINYAQLYVGTSPGAIQEVLADLGLVYRPVARSETSRSTAYFFPIHRWMDEQLRSIKLRHVVRKMAIRLQGSVTSLYDRIVDRVWPRQRVFVQEYHSTRKILRHLQREPRVRLVLANFSADRNFTQLWRERPLSLTGRVGRFHPLATQLLTTFRQRRTARLVLSSGHDATDAAYRVIERRITAALPETLRSLESLIHHLDRHPLALVVLIANIGQVTTLLDCAAKSRGVPSFLIINGILCQAYLDEAKYATVINAYSPSIRDHYFRGMTNIVCLGDPRMDDYAGVPAKAINRTHPTITIGAAGFSNIDLNSYVAVEFEFIEQVLFAVCAHRRRGRASRVVIKVRSNGYRELYERFVAEYFPGLVDRITDDAPMRTLLDATDFYITTYSQTLFEASSLGIPCVFHKNNREIMHPPFDGESELVATHDVPTLEQAMDDFFSGSDRFDRFLLKPVMEKYIGPLDGRNFERNLGMVTAMLQTRTETRIA
jgi:hypothetical protein